jgi:anthranilate phosphoribosyltransferase
MVIHSLDGYDEVSLTGNFKLITRNDERIVSPEDLGLHAFDPGELSGGTSVEEAANIFISVLENTSTRAQKEVAVANAGMALYCADPSLGLQGGIEKARESVESGNALKSFKKLLDI